MENRSSNNAVRGFCGECGSQLFFKSDGRWPDEIHLYAASLEDPEQFRPQAHFHYAEKVDWVTIEDDLPRYAASADGADPI